MVSATQARGYLRDPTRAGKPFYPGLLFLAHARARGDVCGEHPFSICRGHGGGGGQGTMDLRTSSSRKALVWMSMTRRMHARALQIAPTSAAARVILGGREIFPRHREFMSTMIDLPWVGYG